MDEATRQFFRRQQQEDPENQACVDTAAANPQWASVSHGCYISLESSGVHRSLGVHISFVRSTTMDSWKPLQLRLMELGGNRRLRAHFRKHGVPDAMPIAQKYNTRAAEWYRRNLRALAEGHAPPEDLPEGTGHLPVGAPPSATQLAFAKAAAGAEAVQHVSAGGAVSSDARLYGGYHSQGAAGAAGAAAGAPAAPGGAAEAALPRRRMEGLGSAGPARPARVSREVCGSQDDLLGNLFGPDVTSKVSDGVWSAVDLAGDLASRARQFAEEKAARARSEGWLDSALDTARQGLESGAAGFLHASDADCEDSSRPSRSFVDSGMEWIGERARLAGLVPDSAAGLERMSTGRMQGFGPDCLPELRPAGAPVDGLPALPDGLGPASPSTVPASPVALAAVPRDSPPRPTMACYHSGGARELVEARLRPGAGAAPAASPAAAPAAPRATAPPQGNAAARSDPAAAAKVATLWSDEDGGLWA